ncbi:MAG: thiosulfate oxidation carrier protein SoxY [Rhodospirillaceae bacterium]|nr:thiosulfate oxidation carrier protein SoxY [Rhodospirillaceae bacterium]
MRQEAGPQGASRRRILAMGAVGGIVAALAPRLAVAKPADVAAAIKKLYSDKPIAASKVKLDMPQIAENGNVVPVTITVESPMTADDYVKAVHLWSEGNPIPDVATFYFTPGCGKASCSTRMRMANTQFVVAVAETSKGELYTGKTEVKVTIGGCGG